MTKLLDITTQGNANQNHSGTSTHTNCVNWYQNKRKRKKKEKRKKGSTGQGVNRQKCWHTIGRNVEQCSLLKTWKSENENIEPQHSSHCYSTDLWVFLDHRSCLQLRTVSDKQLVFCGSCPFCFPLSAAGLSLALWLLLQLLSFGDPRGYC